jgi:hypothetical protein
MRLLQRLLLLGTAFGAARAVVRYLRQRARPRGRRESETLFGDIELPPVAESPRFPEPLTPPRGAM